MIPIDIQVSMSNGKVKFQAFSSDVGEGGGALVGALVFYKHLFFNIKYISLYLLLCLNVMRDLYGLRRAVSKGRKQNIKTYTYIFIHEYNYTKNRTSDPLLPSVAPLTMRLGLRLQLTSCCLNVYTTLKYRATSMRMHV